VKKSTTRCGWELVDLQRFFPSSRAPSTDSGRQIADPSPLIASNRLRGSVPRVQSVAQATGSSLRKRCQSARSAITGSTELALLAGSHAAPSATAPRTSGTRACGSQECFDRHGANPTESLAATPYGALIRRPVLHPPIMYGGPRQAVSTRVMKGRQRFTHDRKAGSCWTAVPATKPRRHPPGRLPCGWRIPNRAAKTPERNRSRSVGP
jgi:hypothetical protein